MDFYIKMSAKESVPCTKAEFKKIKGLLTASNRQEDHGIDCSFDPKTSTIFFFGEENADTDLVYPSVLKEIGKLLKKNDLPHLELQFSFTARRVVTNSQGGFYVRLMPDGSLVDQVCLWPEQIKEFVAKKKLV